MSYESEEFFRKDLLRCDEWFLKNLNFSPSIYAFPNSDYKKEHLKILRDFGFGHILLVGDNFSKYSDECFHNRFNLHFKDEWSMRFQVTGKFVI